MTITVFLSLLGALILGIWLGLPRRYDQSLDEIDKRLDEPGEHQKVKRHRTFFGLLQRMTERGSSRRRKSGRRPFDMR